MPLAIRAAADPNNKDRRYIFWDNGRIEAWLRPGSLSSMPVTPPTDRIDNMGQTGNGKVPLGEDDTFVAFQITDWTGPGGYVLTKFGQVFYFGTAAAVPFNQQPIGVPGFPYGYNGFKDFWMNPAADGQGYALGDNGTVNNIGGSVIIESLFLPNTFARRIIMPNWTTKKYFIVDGTGAIHSRHGAVQVSVEGRPPGTPLWYGDFGKAAVFYTDAEAGHGDGWMLMSWGWINALNAAQKPFGFPYHENWPYSSDLIVVNDGLGALPLEFAVLNIYGFFEQFTVSTAPTVTTYDTASPADPTTDRTRPTIAWTYADPEGDAEDAVELRVFTAAQYSAGAVNEVQRVTITGTPTGGTFTLTFMNATTAAIAYNASAAAVQAALEALPNIDVGDVVCGGGPLPGSFVTVTFQGKLAGHNWKQMTAVSALTGGSAPVATVTTTTQGVGPDPATLASPVFSVNLGSGDRNVRSVTVDHDLTNGTTYRAYIRATDTAGLKSEWIYRQWLQNVTLPATPILVAAAQSPLGGVKLDVDSPDYASLPGAAGAFVSTPDSAAVSITGDIDLRARVAPNDWTPATQQTFLAKATDPSQQSYELGLRTGGQLFVYWSVGGTGASGVSAQSTVPVGATDGAAKWVRATLDVDNGLSGKTVNFYTSDDGLAWLPLGDPVTTAGTTSIFDSTSVVRIGLWDTTVEPLNGKVYYAEIRNGIGGSVVASPAFTGSPTFADTQGNTWTFNGTATRGVGLVTGSRFGVQYQDNVAEPWRWVPSGVGIVPDINKRATIVDNTARYGVQRSYQAVHYVLDPPLVGLFSATQTATLASAKWTLLDPFSGLGLVVNVRPPFRFDRIIKSGKFYPVGRKRAVVKTDGAPRGAEGDLKLQTLNKGDYDTMNLLLDSGATLLLRDPMGRAWFIAIENKAAFDMMRAGPAPSETTALRHAHEITLPMVEVDLPFVGPATGPLALTA